MHMQNQISMYWEKEARYYQATLSKDLLDTWVIDKIWGSKFNARSGKKTQPVTSYADGLLLLQNLSKRRTTRGYSPKNTIKL